MSARRPTLPAAPHEWEFKARFRRHAFGWKSQPAIQRVEQAVSEIKKVARRDPVLAAEGAVLFLERVSAAIEQVDGSSGAIGTAVSHAVEDLVAVIAEAPADAATRDAWLERLWERSRPTHSHRKSLQPPGRAFMAIGTWLLSDRVTGLLLLALLGMQGFTMRLAPGALRLQKPEGGAIAWVYNVFNLGLLLGLTPLAAGCLIVGARGLVSWGQWSSAGDAIFLISRSIGLAIYVFGCFLMLWSRIVLGKSFRLGAVRPDREDQLVTSGPFQFVRHPMYSAVVLMAFGLSFLLNSWVVLGLAVAFGLIVLLLIPIEETLLESAYADAYRTLRSRTWCLIPWVY